MATTDARKAWLKTPAGKEYSARRGRTQRQRARDECLDRYGRECSCCGETHPEFLCFDHVDGGGNQHRKQVGATHGIARWLRTHGFPEGFQTLCWNCNSAKHFYGTCPHQASV